MASPVLVSGDLMVGVIKGLLAGQSVQTTFHWRATSVPTAYTLTSFLQDLLDDIVPEYRLCLSSDWTGFSVYGRRVSPNPTRGQEQATGTMAGLVSSTSLPPSVAAVLSRFTNQPGPKGRGRVFMPAVPSSFNTNGQVNTTGKNIYDAFLPWLDITWPSSGGATFEPILLTPPADARNIEFAQTRIVLRSQRRREIGVGI